MDVEYEWWKISIGRDVFEGGNDVEKNNSVRGRGIQRSPTWGRRVKSGSKRYINRSRDISEGQIGEDEKLDEIKGRSEIWRCILWRRKWGRC